AHRNLLVMSARPIRAPPPPRRTRLTPMDTSAEIRDDFGDLVGQRHRRRAPVVDRDVRRGRLGGQPHAGGGALEVGQLCGVPAPPRRAAAPPGTQPSRAGSPPSAAPGERHRPASWIAGVTGADSTPGPPGGRPPRAAAVTPPYSCTLTCSSYHGPSRSPGGRP